MKQDAKTLPTEPPVKFQITAQEHFDFSSPAYRNLFEHSGATAFQSPFWLDHFYRKLVRQVGAQPLIITVHLEGSRTPDAVIPLVREKYYGFHILQPADLGIADYNSIIGERHVLNLLASNSDFKSQLIRCLDPFDIVLFRKQRPDTFDAGLLFNQVRMTPSVSSAYEIDLEAGYDQWFKTTLSRNMRKGLKRKRNLLEREIGSLEFQELSDPQEIRQAFETMQSLRADRFKTDLLSKPEYFDFYLDVAISGSQSGETSTLVGKSKGNLVTVEFGLRQNERFLFLLGAFSGAEEHRKYSLGLMGLNEVIRQKAEQGFEKFDLTIGDEPYKQSFGAKQVALTNVSVTNGLRGQAAFTAYQSTGPGRRLLKMLMPGFS